MMKDEEIYNIFDTEKLLSRPAAVAVSANSGLAGIACWLNRFYRLRGDDKADKRSPLVAELKEWVDAQYAAGRTTSISDEELDRETRRIKAQGVEVKA